jgi:hypothetical protein
MQKQAVNKALDNLRMALELVLGADAAIEVEDAGLSHREKTGFDLVIYELIELFVHIHEARKHTAKTARPPGATAKAK